VECGYGEEWKRSAGLIKLLIKEVLRRVNEDRQIRNSIWQRKHRWIGHVLRHDGLLHEITVGRMGEEFKCYMIWQTMVALLHSSGQLRTDRVETQRKDVKNLLYSRRRLIIELNSRRLLTMRITHLGRIRVVATALATTTTETDAVLMLFFVLPCIRTQFTQRAPAHVRDAHTSLPSIHRMRRAFTVENSRLLLGSADVTPYGAWNKSML